MRTYVPWVATGVAVLVTLLVLATDWVPLGPERGLFLNTFFVVLVIGGALGVMRLFIKYYEPMLRWCLAHRLLFLSAPALAIAAGVWIWMGLGREFMPSLDEGSFLFMPSTMPHASMGEALDVLSKQDMAIRAIPEVRTVVGKIGRAETPLDPAPVSMVETIIDYRPEYIVDGSGRRLRFRWEARGKEVFSDRDGRPLPARDGKPYLVPGVFARDANGDLVPDGGGRPFRQWRRPLDPGLNPGRDAWPGVTKPGDIWEEIVRAGRITGSTSAPKLQPIETRLVMLQSGMRAPMGIKVSGPDLETIERYGLELERIVRGVPGVRPSSVQADRIVGKPYIDIHVDREKAARYGASVTHVQRVIEVAIGGKTVTTTVEGRERYPVRVRYARELRDRIDTLGRVLVSTTDGAQVPLEQLAEVTYSRGPQSIKSEDGFLLGYVLFGKEPGFAEVDVVEDVRAAIARHEGLGLLKRPDGVSISFAGNYRNQVRASRRLMLVVPAALVIIFVILYLQFRSTVKTLIVFSGIAVAWAGGFIMIWLYAQPWFLNFSLFGTNMRELFGADTVNMSIAVWVGFLALFGIATDDGVVMTTYLDQVFGERKPVTPQEVREAVVVAGMRRIRPCLMTTATTILALLPVLTSTGRGADIMVPMAIPVFGGMMIELLTLFVVPVCYSMRKSGT